MAQPGSPRKGETGESHALLTFAGLWERWKDGMLSCTILTCEACDGIRDLHTRMPVMLPPQGFEPWLGGDDPTVDPGLDAAVKVTPVSPKMNSPSTTSRTASRLWSPKSA